MTRRILIVEDETILMMVVAMAFEDHGFEVVTAPNGRRGLEAARTASIDAIVTDYMMPGLDGLEMLQALREEGVNTPAIMITAIPQDQLGLQGKPPFDRYMTKPYDEEQLVTTVKTMLDG
ncbi:two-component system OmpR family response regulator/two-component system response regulator HydG [Palleronia aestuarii]|uniref:Two-component system OmpR family response regulator/two-component system response regulator HydG n=1 Tax=Palleronia aestuarii TaxID=568105 RepID=A0A2W7MQ21_9RHOB|nr:response regulator [Palleronia aestuarii]PZX09958.1 two-component system OmpR family response regulator/two-component system response regulator HydG [Palleronia aestuarii]